MASKEELKLHRHQLYCSVADACQQGSVNGSTAALLSQLQAVLEAESCLSCIEEDCNAGPGGNNSTGQVQLLRPSSKQLRQQHKQRHASGGTPTSKHAPAASAASSAVQLLKDELAHKLHAAVQRSSPGIKAGAAASALLADLAAAQQAQAQLEDSLLAAQAALLQQKQQHKHDVSNTTTSVNTWRLAAEQAADLAEASNQRAASCEGKLADAAQQLAEQARATLKLGEELKQARGQLDGRWEQEQQLYSTIMRPLLKWQQQQLAKDYSTAASPVAPRKQYSSSSSPHRHCPVSILSDEMLLAAAAAVEQLLLRDVDKQAAVAEARREMQAEQNQVKQQLQARAAQLEQELQATHGTVQDLQGQLQQLQAELQLAEQQSVQDKQCMHELQRQLADHAAAASEQQQQLEASLTQQHATAVTDAVEKAASAAESRAEQVLQQKEEQLSELQQQLAQLFQELAVAQEQAAEYGQQVMQLQVQLEQAMGTVEQQQQESKHELKCRLVQQQAEDLAQQRSTLHQLSADKAAALAAAERHAAAALQAAEREHWLAMEAAQQAWERQKAVLEEQRVQAVLQARLAAQQQLEKERQQWQSERDALVQKLTVQHASAELQAQRAALRQQQDLLQQLQSCQQGRQTPNQPAPAATATQQALSWHHHAGAASAYGTLRTAVSAASAAGVGDALKFSQALTAAEADRRAALKQAVTAQGESRQLREQLEQQEQELHHLRRALDEMQHACQAADSASREAEASSSASAAALQEQLLKVRQLQAQLDTVSMQHSMEMQAAQQSMREQVAVIQSDACAELEAAQTRMQLLRLKQQRMAKCLANGQLPAAADTLTAWRDRH